MDWAYLAGAVLIGGVAVAVVSRLIARTNRNDDGTHGGGPTAGLTGGYGPD
ncbi:MAG: hypothetical protein U0871_27480 [Gemmataceae bacterium]